MLMALIVTVILLYLSFSKLNTYYLGNKEQKHFF